MIMAQIPDVNKNWRNTLLAIERELELIGLDIEAKAVEYLDRKDVNVTGDLRKSITHEVSRELNSIRLQVGTNLGYAVFVHEGTKPHWPPKAPIRKWVIKKLGIKGEETDKVTFAVRRKIGRKGTKAKPFLAVAFRIYRNVIGYRIGRAIERAQG